MNRGQTGYEAFQRSLEGDGGEDMQPWERLTPRLQAAWDAASQAIAKEVYDAVRAFDDGPATEPAPEGYPR